MEVLLESFHKERPQIVHDEKPRTSTDAYDRASDRGVRKLGHDNRYRLF